MSETKIDSAETTLTDSQQEVLELSDILKGFNYSLWGHGTPHDGSESFFNDGVYASNYGDMSSIAIPLDSSNIKSIDDWPHKKYTNLPKVVLLGIPNPDPERGVPFSQVLTQIIEERGSDEFLPPKYVLGFYEPSNKSLIINPAFDLTQESHTKAIEHMRSKISKQPHGTELLESLLGSENTIAPKPIPAPPKDEAGKYPYVW